MAAALIAVIHAHPYPRRSRACAALTEAIRDLPGVELRMLYELYPDFDVDAAAERFALERAKLVVLLHPLYWYTAPALLKLWFEQVLTKGWAYGDKGTALAGKECLWVTTAGGDEQAFSALGRRSESGSLRTGQPHSRPQLRRMRVTWRGDTSTPGSARTRRPWRGS